MKTIRQVLFIFLITAPVFAQNPITSNGIDGQSFELKTDQSSLHYEKYGSGTPLLVLHGNGGSTKSVYGLLPSLISDFEVIAVDSPCHGQSSCAEELLSFGFIADEIAHLIDELGYEKVNIWGHSDGGIVALMLGYSIPDKISRMLVSGANTRLDTTALYPEIVSMIHRYEEIQNPALRTQIKLMATQEPIPASKLRNISVPVTLMVGDRDAVKMEHTLELFQTIPQANLCVLPGTSHFLENPQYVLIQIKQLKQPFTSPSTLQIVEQIARQIFSN